MLLTNVELEGFYQMLEYAEMKAATLIKMFEDQL